MDPNFDLTGAMVEAAHEIGVAAPIYITAGWCALDSANHPEWRMIQKDGTPLDMHVDPNASPDDPRPDCSWWDLCMTGDYAQHIYDLTQEVVDRYPVVDGLFYDIVFRDRACYRHAQPATRLTHYASCSSTRSPTPHGTTGRVHTTPASTTSTPTSITTTYACSQELQPTTRTRTTATMMPQATTDGNNLRKKFHPILWQFRKIEYFCNKLFK
jgi:hypothetical protein